MKELLLDFLTGLIHGLLYLYGFIGIAVGVYLMCKLHTFSLWLAVVTFPLALVIIVAGFLGIAILGKRILEDEK